nr:MAG TPA: adenine specific DNA methyltransferase [Caudoviricetes sp.]
MEIKTLQLPLSKIHPNTGQLVSKGIPKNPRFIREGKYEKLLQSIKDDPEMLSLRELIVMDSGDKNVGYVIIGGNMRFRAMKELGYKEAPTKILPSDFPVDKARRIILKDNASFGETDFDALLSDWSIEDISSAAIDIPDIDDPHLEEAEDAEEDNFDVAGNIPKIAQAKDGDIYRLGEHRLICGDSTKQEYINALMDGDMADLLVTDPPYNVDYSEKNEALNRADGGKLIQRDIVSDKMDEEAFVSFLMAAFKSANSVMRAGAAFYVWFADNHFTEVWKSLTSSQLNVKQQLIWNKNNLVLGRLDYQMKHEPCLYGWKDGAAHYFVDKRNLLTVIEDKKDLENMSKQEMKDSLEKIFLRQELPSTVIDCDKPQRSADHPTMKPIPLMGRLIANSSRRKDIVLDIFGGSGTTLIASEQLGRKCRMVEYEPIYVDVIIKRWEELTGMKAFLMRNIHEGKSDNVKDDTKAKTNTNTDKSKKEK